MGKRIVIIQGHPDSAPQRFCRLLQSRYQRGAEHGGHQVDIVDLAGMDVPFLRSKAAFETDTPPADIQNAQRLIQAADHLLIIFPLWLGDMPALLKAFFEQAFRPGFAYRGSMDRGKFELLLKGKSARVIVTMGMPAVIYRIFYRAHGLKSLRRNILRFCGIGPVRETLIGLIERKDPAPRNKWMARIEKMGQRGE